jgi:hypothetical protein
LSSARHRRSIRFDAFRSARGIATPDAGLLRRAPAALPTGAVNYPTALRARLPIAEMLGPAPPTSAC